MDLVGEELREREPDFERDRLLLLDPELLLDRGELERDRSLPLPAGDAGVISLSDIVTKDSSEIIDNCF